MKVYSVSQINYYLKSLIENDIFLRNVYIEAEISNFKAHSSGHFYLTLKDSSSAINAVMFRSYTGSLKFVPKNGMKVLAGGYISIYEKTGQYQLYITSLEPAGKGALYLAYEQLKARLEKAGVFDKKYKKPIPQFPKCVAVITSSTGAAVRDIINVTGRRNPNVDIVVVPVLVQGENAAKDIVKAIETVNKWGKADTIIVGRGGGSIEDLWAFNEEIVARAIFYSEIPVISAVGHETDVTIADFISDKRAPTPSAAAELAVPEYNNLSQKVMEFHKRLNNIIKNKLSNYKYRYSVLNNNRNFRFFSDKIYDAQIYNEELYNRLNNKMDSIIDKNKLKLCSAADNLENNSPLNILKKGYSLVYANKKVIRSVNDINDGDNITVKVCDGEFDAKVIK